MFSKRFDSQMAKDVNTTWKPNITIFVRFHKSCICMGLIQPILGAKNGRQIPYNAVGRL
jgi:hypothetical protein